MSIAARVEELAKRAGKVISDLRAKGQGVQFDANGSYLISDQKTILIGDLVVVELFVIGSFPAGNEVYPVVMRAPLRPLRYTAGAAVVMNETNNDHGSASAYIFPSGAVSVANGNRTATRARISFSYVRIP